MGGAIAGFILFTVIILGGIYLGMLIHHETEPLRWLKVKRNIKKIMGFVLPPEWRVKKLVFYTQDRWKTMKIEIEIDNFNKRDWKDGYIFYNIRTKELDLTTFLKHITNQQIIEPPEKTKYKVGR